MRNENPLRIAICEDLETDALLLESHIGKSGVTVECQWFKSGEEFLQTFQGQYELVFMDIYMSGIKGVDVVQEIRKSDENVVIVFTTASTDYTLESYRLGALKYLEKPVNLGGVREAIMLAALKRQIHPKIILPIGRQQTEIALDSILYFEQKDHSIFVYTLEGVLKASQSVKMNGIEAELKEYGFLRCHHSFIVNLRHVVRLDRDFIMKNNGKAHIRQTDYKKISDEYKRYLICRTRGEIRDE